MPAKALKTIQDVDSAAQDLGFEVDAFLRGRGWKCSSSNPACMWLWEKKLKDERVILTGKDTALAFERHAQGSEF